jgi:4-amino-4-deoxy-L-arabinose transferase-like glycosyltransferase
MRGVPPRDREGTLRLTATLTAQPRGPATAFPTSLRLALLFLTACRLVAAARIPLTADESYYWVWSKVPAWGYLDHPPMVAWWIRIGTSIGGDHTIAVRLLAPVAALLGSLLLLRAAEDLAPGRRAGLPAVLLLNATLALNAGAVIMTPDTPLLFFWTASLAALGRLIRTGNRGWWLGFGLAAGLALDSKYTAFLLGASVLLWVAIVPAARCLARGWQFWAAGAIALTLFAPILAWNAAHGFASFAKQGGRTGDWHPADALRFLAELLAGQLGLATPGVAILFVIGIIGAVRALVRRGEAALGLLACLSVLPATVFLEHALGDRVQANWPAILYPGAALAAAICARAWWRPAAALGFTLSLAVTLQAATGVFRLPRALDFTLIRMAGWSDLAGSVFVAEAHEHAQYVAADNYGVAAELAFRLHTQVVGIEPRWSYFTLPPISLGGETGILVRSTRAYGEPDPRLWSDIVQLGTVTRQRGGVDAETYRIYRVAWKAARGAPAPVLLPSSRPTLPELAPP